MADDEETPSREPREYDVRRNPRRGVRIHPLPRGHHREFRRLCAESIVYIQSQLSTWHLAARDTPDHAFVQGQLVYWSAALRWMRHLEYFATHNAPPRNP